MATKNPYTDNGTPPAAANPNGGGIYLGVEAGSDLEQMGLTQRKTGPFGMKMYPVSRKPLYKVGYQNSKQFSRELNNMDPNVIFLYQQRLNAAGMLDKFTPGKLDKATRGAFKELLSTANQSATTWQQTLQEIESTGGLVSTRQQPDAFVAQLDDPATLREAFQQAAQNLYGGDLPDAEVNAMVDAYRSIQLQKQKAAYDASLNAADGGVSSTIEAEASPSAFAAEQIKAKHPDQVNRVKFQDTLGTILQTLGSSPAGGA